MHVFSVISRRTIDKSLPYNSKYTLFIFYNVHRSCQSFLFPLFIIILQCEVDAYFLCFTCVRHELSIPVHPVYFITEGDKCFSDVTRIEAYCH